MNNYNHALPGLTRNDLPPVSPDGFPVDFLCTEEVYGYCLPLTPQREMDMTTYRPECSRRLRWASFQLWLNCSKFLSDFVNYQINGKSCESHLFLNQAIQILWATVRFHHYPFWIETHSKHPDSLLWGTSPDFFTAVGIHTWKVNYWSFTGCGWPLVQCGELDMKSVLYSLITVKHLIQFHTGSCCRSSKTMAFTNRSVDGLHIISAHILNMFVWMDLI